MSKYWFEFEDEQGLYSTVELAGDSVYEGIRGAVNDYVRHREVLIDLVPPRTFTARYVAMQGMERAYEGTMRIRFDRRYGSYREAEEAYRRPINVSVDYTVRSPRNKQGFRHMDIKMSV